MNIKSRIFTALLMPVLLSGSAAWAAAGKLTFGVEASYAPYEYKSADGKLQGMDIEIGNAICSQLNLQCQWKENSFDGMIPALKARKFDAINSCMNITDERKKQVDFTDVIYRLPMQLIAAKDREYEPTPGALKGKSVGVLQGSVMERYAKKYWQTAGVNVVSYPDQSQIYADLATGRLDAAFQGVQAAIDGFLKKPEGKNFHLTGAIPHDDAIFGPGTAIALRKDDHARLEQLNQAIRQLKNNGTLEKITKKYFSADIIQH